jgi:hypothetical protein
VAETCSTRVKTDVLKVALKTVILSVKVYALLHRLYLVRKVKLSLTKLNSVALVRATAAVGEVVPTFADRWCYVVSATDSHGR